MPSFAGKVALVVGGSSGIGRATAIAFGREGANVVVAGRNEAGGGDTVKAVAGTGAKAHFVRADATKPAEVEAAVKVAEDRFGGLDFAFNNAGWEGTAVPTHEIALADWQRMIDTKLNGAWYGMKYQLAALLKRGGGAVVNMVGNWGLVGFPGYASYCAAAHGVMGLTRAAALEYARKNIRINAVCPGAVDAPLLERMVGGNRGALSGFAEATAMGRLASADEVADAVIWLCSPKASYVNGHGLVLNGGGGR